MTLELQSLACLHVGILIVRDFRSLSSFIMFSLLENMVAQNYVNLIVLFFHSVINFSKNTVE